MSRFDRRCFFAVVYSIGASACGGGVSAYVSPADGARASVTFDSKSTTGHTSSSDQYLNFGIHGCLGGEVAYVTVPPKSKKTVWVRATEELFVSLKTVAHGGSGTVYVSFVPDEGKSYRVVYTALRGPAGSDSMQIDVTSSDGNPVSVARGTKGWPRCKNQSGQS